MGNQLKTRIMSALGALAAAGPPAMAAPTRLQLQRDVDALRDLGVTGVLARLETPAGVQAVRSGVAEAGTSRPVPARPYLRAASITKTFVATVILQLAAEGTLSLSDPVERWLPGVVTGNGNDGRKITIRRLLQQTSGLYNYSADLYPSLATPEDYRRNRWQTATPAELVATAMRHAPGEQTWASRPGPTSTPTTYWPAWSSRRPPATTGPRRSTPGSSPRCDCATPSRPAPGRSSRTRTRTTTSSGRRAEN